MIPTVLGYDARLQFIHEDDGLEVLRRAVIEDHPGTFNIAADGVLLLSQAARRAGRLILPIPVPFASLVGAAFRRAGMADFSPEQIRFLTYGRGVANDTTRMREVFGFTPQHTTAETFDEFMLSRNTPRLLPPEKIESAERHVVSLLGGGRAHA